MNPILGYLAILPALVTVVALYCHTQLVSRSQARQRWGSPVAVAYEHEKCYQSLKLLILITFMSWFVWGIVAAAVALFS